MFNVLIEHISYDFICKRLADLLMNQRDWILMVSDLNEAGNANGVTSMI